MKNFTKISLVILASLAGAQVLAGQGPQVCPGVENSGAQKPYLLDEMRDFYQTRLGRKLDFSPTDWEKLENARLQQNGVCNFYDCLAKIEREKLGLGEDKDGIGKYDQMVTQAEEACKQKKSQLEQYDTCGNNFFEAAINAGTFAGFGALSLYFATKRGFFRYAGIGALLGGIYQGIVALSHGCRYLYTKCCPQVVANLRYEVKKQPYMYGLLGDLPRFLSALKSNEGMDKEFTGCLCQHPDKVDLDNKKFFYENAEIDDAGTIKPTLKNFALFLEKSFSSAESPYASGRGVFFDYQRWIKELESSNKYNELLQAPVSGSEPTSD